MKSKFSYLFILLFVISCSQENTTVGEDDLSSRTYFNEFMPCQAGPDYSAENMAKIFDATIPLYPSKQTPRAKPSKRFVRPSKSSLECPSR